MCTCDLAAVVCVGVGFTVQGLVFWCCVGSCVGMGVDVDVGVSVDYLDAQVSSCFIECSTGLLCVRVSASASVSPSASALVALCLFWGVRESKCFIDEELEGSEGPLVMKVCRYGLFT